MKIIIAVITSGYSFLTLLAVCQFGSYLPAFLLLCFSLGVLYKVSILALITCAAARPAPLDKAADFQSIPKSGFSWKCRLFQHLADGKYPGLLPTLELWVFLYRWFVELIIASVYLAAFSK